MNETFKILIDNPENTANELVKLSKEYNLTILSSKTVDEISVILLMLKSKK